MPVFKASSFGQLNYNIYPASPHYAFRSACRRRFFWRFGEESKEGTSVFADNKCLVGGNLFEFDWAQSKKTTMFSQQQYLQFFGGLDPN
jgi:hypothetical protein